MKFQKSLAALLVGLASASAQATLIGDTITFATYFPTDGTQSSIQDFLVGPGIECSGCDSGGFVLPGQTLDIGADYIDFASGFETSFDGPDAIFEFTGLDFAGGAVLTGFSLTTSFASVTAADVSYTGDSIRVNIGGSGLGSGWRLELRTTAAVPVSGTLSLAGLGLLGLAALRQRRSA